MELINEETRVLIYSGSMVDDEELYSKLRFVDWQEDLPGPDCHLCGEMILPLGEFMDHEDDKYNNYEIYWRGDIDDKDEDNGVLQCSYCLNYFHRRMCSLSMSDNSVISAYFKKSWSCPSCVPEFIPSTTTKLRCVINQKDNDDILQKLFVILNKFSELDYILVIDTTVELIRVMMLEKFDVNMFEIG